MHIDSKAIKEQLNTQIIGENIIVLPSVDSTNSYLKDLESAVDGTVVIAEAQSGGRGRRGRSFWSPKGGVYMSVMHSVSVGFDAGKITSCVALSVCKAIEKLTELQPKIKWVNDVFVNNKKVCGILCEATNNPETSLIEGVIIGIGLNVCDAGVPAELKEIATSLNRESKMKISHNTLIAEILNNLENELNTINNDGLIVELSKRSLVLGKRVIVNSTTESYEAEALKLDSSCGLVIKRGEEVLTLSSGEVSIICN